MENETAILFERARASEAARQIEDDRIIAEGRLKAQKEAAERLEAERVADVEHRKEVEQSVVGVMAVVIQECGLLSTAEIAQAIADGIIEGRIPHVTINYSE